MTYKDAIGDFRSFFDGDAWGTTLHFWFTVADEIHFNRDELEVPESWEFRPSPLGAANDPDDYAMGIVTQLSDSDLIRFGALLNRYAGVLKRAGESY